LNIRAEILKEHSKAQTIKIANYIGDSQPLFDELMDLFLNDEYRVSQRSAWVVSHCVEVHPQLVEPHLQKIIENLRKPGLHDAVKRNTVKVLRGIEVPEELEGLALNHCFDFLTSQKETVAVKVFAMTVLLNICQKEPDLLLELQIIIEDQMPYSSAGFRSRGKKVLKAIDRVLQGH